MLIASAHSSPDLAAPCSRTHPDRSAPRKITSPLCAKTLSLTHGLERLVALQSLQAPPVCSPGHPTALGDRLVAQSSVSHLSLTPHLRTFDSVGGSQPGNDSSPACLAVEGPNRVISLELRACRQHGAADPISHISRDSLQPASSLTTSINPRGANQVGVQQTGCSTCSDLYLPDYCEFPPVIRTAQDRFTSATRRSVSY